MARMRPEGKARRQRRAFTEEFKAGAVGLVLDEKKTVAAVARDLDVTESALRVWVERARADRTGGKTGLTTEERAELALKPSSFSSKIQSGWSKGSATRTSG